MTLNRRMAGRLVVWLLAGATVAGGTPVLAQASQAAAAPAFKQLPTWPELSGVWCAGPSKCLAVGGDFQNAPISMTWNGRDWSFVKEPAKGHGPNALACTSWSHCMAVGYAGVADEWNGVSWRALRTPSPINLDSIACPAPRMCVAVGSSISAKGATAMVWNGRTWRATPVPWPAGVMLRSLASVACPSVGYCVAVGDYLRPTSYSIQIAMTWNGARWRRAPTPPKKAFVIACPRSRLCVAISSIQSLMWNRHSWRQVRMPALNTPESISCPGRSFCMVDSEQVTEVWNGRSWSKIPPAHNGTHVLWCGSPRDCMAVGDGSRGGNASQWNGRSWRVLRVTKVDGLDAISCGSTTDCIAVGTSNVLGNPGPLAERWNGTAWTVIPGPSVSGHLGITPLSCPATSFCMAVGTSAAQRWDGSTWHATSVPALTGGASLSSVSCTSPDNCVSVGTDAAIVWNGSSWKTTDAGITGQTVTLTSVSCSGAMCMASGYHSSSTCVYHCEISFLAEEWNGSTWAITDDVPSGTDPSYVISNVSCPTSTFCMEAGFSFSAMTWNGTTWQPASASGDLVLDSLSCARAVSCLTVGTVDVFIGRSLTPKTITEVWNGTSWQVAKSVPIGNGLDSVSCPSSGTCVAVGTDNNFLAVAQAWNGTSWTPLAPANP